VSELARECYVRLTPDVAPALAKSVAALWAQEGVEPVMKLEVDTPLSMLRLVGEGAGFSLLPASAIATRIPGCVNQPLASDPCNVDTALVVAFGETSPAVRQLRSIARGALTGSRLRAA